MALSFIVFIPQPDLIHFVSLRELENCYCTWCQTSFSTWMDHRKVIWVTIYRQISKCRYALP